MVRLAPGGASRSAQLPRSRRRRCTSRSGTTALPCAASGEAGVAREAQRCQSERCDMPVRVACTGHKGTFRLSQPCLTLYFSLRMKCEDQISTCEPVECLGMAG